MMFCMQLRKALQLFQWFNSSTRFTKISQINKFLQRPSIGSFRISPLLGLFPAVAHLWFLSTAKKFKEPSQGLSPIASASQAICIKPIYRRICQQNPQLIISVSFKCFSLYNADELSPETVLNVEAFKALNRPMCGISVSSHHGLSAAGSSAMTPLYTSLFR